MIVYYKRGGKMSSETKYEILKPKFCFMKKIRAEDLCRFITSLLVGTSGPKSGDPLQPPV
jgi:hypothetical protein